MRKLCLCLCISTLSVALSGCALFGSELNKAAEGAGKLVTFYCDNVSSADVREQFRVAVNEHAAPNSVIVTCANSAAPPLIVNPQSSTGAYLMPTTNPNEIARLARNHALAASALTDAAKPPAVSFADDCIASLANDIIAVASRVNGYDTELADSNARLNAHISSLGALSTRLSDQATELQDLSTRIAVLENATRQREV